MSDDVELYDTMRGRGVRWRSGTDADEIERAVPPGWAIAWGQTVVSAAPGYDYAAPIVRGFRKGTKTIRSKKKPRAQRRKRRQARR